MSEMSILGAAGSLGVSPDTVRRRVRAGLLVARRDATGKWLVHVDDPPDSDPNKRSDSSTCPTGESHAPELDQLRGEVVRLEQLAQRQEEELARLRGDSTTLRREGELLRELLDEVRAARDHAYADAADLWYLLGNAQRQLRGEASPTRD